MSLSEQNDVSTPPPSKKNYNPIFFCKEISPSMLELGADPNDLDFTVVSVILPEIFLAIFS